MVGKENSNKLVTKHCVGVSSGESPVMEDSCGGPGIAIGSHVAVPQGTGIKISPNVEFDKNRDSSGSKIYKIPKKSTKKAWFV